MDRSSVNALIGDLHVNRRILAALLLAPTCAGVAARAQVAEAAQYGVRPDATAVSTAAHRNVVRGTQDASLGLFPSDTTTGAGPTTFVAFEPFAVEDNNTYFYPNNPGRYAFFILYHGTPLRPEPGLYLYNPATKQWSLRASMNQLPTGQWVRVSDADGNAWPLGLNRQQSGTVMAQWE